jgi:8-oxo-dGTP pyrophosphatase MutT (NUDIX family)
MLVKRKKAAGGVIIRTDQPSNQQQVLLVQHRESMTWGFPKGHIDPGESPDQTALREVEEETGVVGRIVDTLPTTRYQFTTRNGVRIDKEVAWFLMEQVGIGTQTHAHEVASVRWMQIDAAYENLDFDNNRSILTTALQRIDA